MNALKIYEKAPAKINLLLDVIHKRKDGFHEVNMIMTMIDLADRLEISQLVQNEILVSSQGEYIPLDQNNLVFRAAHLIKNKYSVRKGVHIHLHKNIPVAAGLAGGSSDAAATLRGLNRLWQLNLSNTKLQRLGAVLGSDVPFCVTGGTALATGRGEVLTQIPNLPQGWVVLARIPIHVSTSEVYNRFRNNNIDAYPSMCRMENAIRRQCFSHICLELRNVLEDITVKIHPEIQQLKDMMCKLGAEGVLMSGSGPTVFGLVSKERKARAIYNGLRGFCKEVYVVRLLTS